MPQWAGCMSRLLRGQAELILPSNCRGMRLPEEARLNSREAATALLLQLSRDPCEPQRMGTRAAMGCSTVLTYER